MNSNNKIVQIDTDLLKELTEQAKGFVFKPEAEYSLTMLLAAQNIVSDALDTVKAILKEEALKRDPTTRSIEGDILKVTFSPSGARYVLTDQTIAPPEVLKIDLDTKLVDKYIEEHKRVPDGIAEKERGLSVKISVKGE